MKTIALIVAGGKSERFGGDVPKQFRTISGMPVLSWTISKFEKARSIDQIVVVVAEEYLLYTSEKIIDPYHFSKVIKVVVGGEKRTESVYYGLTALPLSTDYVAIHDGARPLVSSGDIDRVVAVAHKEKAALLGIKATDTVKRVKEEFVITTLDRDSLYLAQTPQVFQYDLIKEAHTRLAEQKEHKFVVTDDASLIEQSGFKVKIVESSSPNFKITTADDFKLAGLILNKGEYE